MKVTRTRHSAVDQTALVRQVRQVQEHYPELYEHLMRRDRAIERAVARIPNWADIELSSAVGTRGYLEKVLRGLPPGVAELCETEADRV